LRNFNVATDPWIPVILNGKHRELSLRETLAKAHLITGLAGATGQEDVAILRLLSACVAHLAPNTGDHGADWKRAFAARSFPDFDPYFTAHHSEFELFSDAPFYQVTDPGISGPLSKLVLGSATDPARAVLSAAGPTSLSYAEATRALVTTMLWDIVGIHSGAPADPRTKGGKAYSPSYRDITLIAHNPVSYGGALIIEGRMLKNTILLNTPFTARGTDIPLWERGPRAAEQTLGTDGEPIAPSGLVSYLTWGHRSIRLEREGDRVTSAFVSYGDIVNHVGTLYDFEPASAWYFKASAKRYLPHRLNRETVWEGLPSATGFAPDTDKVAPDVAALAVRHLQELVTDGNIARISDVVTGYVEVSWVLGPKDSTISGISTSSLPVGTALTSELPTQAAAASTAVLAALRTGVFLAVKDGLVPETAIQVVVNEFRSRVDAPYRALISTDPKPREARIALTAWRRDVADLAVATFTSSLASHIRPGRQLAFARCSKTLTRLVKACIVDE